MSKINEKKPVILVIDDRKKFPDKLNLLDSYQFIHVGLNKIDKESILAEIDTENLDNNQLELILLDLEFENNEGNEDTKSSIEDFLGIDLIPSIKERFNKVPVLIITIYGDLTIRRKCLEAGADNFLRKDEFEELQWRKIFDVYIENKRLKEVLAKIHKYSIDCI